MLSKKLNSCCHSIEEKTYRIYKCAVNLKNLVFAKLGIFLAGFCTLYFYLLAVVLSNAYPCF